MTGTVTRQPYAGSYKIEAGIFIRSPLAMLLRNCVATVPGFLGEKFCQHLSWVLRYRGHVKPEEWAGWRPSTESLQQWLCMSKAPRGQWGQLPLKLEHWSED